MSKLIKTDSEALNMYLESRYIKEFWDQNQLRRAPWAEEENQWV